MPIEKMINWLKINEIIKLWCQIRILYGKQKDSKEYCF